MYATMECELDALLNLRKTLKVRCRGLGCDGLRASFLRTRATCLPLSFSFRLVSSGPAHSLRSLVFPGSIFLNPPSLFLPFFLGPSFTPRFLLLLSCCSFVPCFLVLPSYPPHWLAPLCLQESGVTVSVNDVVVKAAAQALRAVPEVNCAWDEGSQSVVENEGVSVSVAVATDGGLITPIVPDTDTKGLSEINASIKDLASRARAGARV